MDRDEGRERRYGQDQETRSGGGHGEDRTLGRRTWGGGKASLRPGET